MLKTTMGSMDLEKKHSTVIVILEMVEVLTTTTTNNSWSSIEMFTYLINQAFNTVGNIILLQKLEHCALEL